MGSAGDAATVFTAVLERLPSCVSPDAEGELLTLPFLDTCRQVLPVIESLGTPFIPARADVSGNIERLAARAADCPEDSVLLFSIVRAEVSSDAAASSTSCTKGLLWLKRFLEFTVRLLERLSRDPELELGAAASAAYDATLRPFHGYITCTLFSVIMRAAPYRATFERALVTRSGAPAPAQGADAEPDLALLRAHMAQFVDKFAPLLARIHVFLTDIGQDDPATV